MDKVTDILINCGVLQEVNRTFFHPLGLELNIGKLDNKVYVSYTDNPQGFTFDHIDKIKHDAFRKFSRKKYDERNDILGFIIQVLDLYRSDNLKKIDTLRSPEKQRLDIILKAFDFFIWIMHNKIIDKHKKYDSNMGFATKEELKKLLMENIEKEDWVDVANISAMLHQLDDISKNIEDISYAKSE